MGNSSVTTATSLHVIRIHSRRSTSHHAPFTGLLTSVVVDVLDVKCVDVAWYISKQGQTDVDKKIFRLWLVMVLSTGGRNLPIPHPATAHTPMGGTGKC